MWCTFCGKELRQEAVYCPYCGRKKEIISKTEVDDNQIINETTENTENVPLYRPYSEETNSEGQNEIYFEMDGRSFIDTTAKRKKRNDTLLIALIVFITLFSVMILATTVVLVSRAGKFSGGSDTYSEFERTVTFDTGYSYSGFSDIYSSRIAEDKDSEKMAKLVKNYNDAWIEYINKGDDSLFEYLRQGTEAYSKADTYSGRNMKESFRLFEVEDVRQTSNHYYVFTHEILDVYENGKSSVYEYHWIYRISSDSKGHYVDSYISDPYYK